MEERKRQRQRPFVPRCATDQKASSSRRRSELVSIEPPHLQQNFHDRHGRSQSTRPRIPLKSGSYDQHNRTYDQKLNQGRQSFHQERACSRPDQWESEEALDNIVTSGSLRERISSQRMRTSRERTSLAVNDNNQPISPSPRPVVSSSTRAGSEEGTSNQPVLQPRNQEVTSPMVYPTTSSEVNTNIQLISSPSKPAGISSLTRMRSGEYSSNQPKLHPSEAGPSSSMRRHLTGNANKQPVSSAQRPPATSTVQTSKSLVSTSGENQPEKLSQNSKNGSQSTSVHKIGNNQQASSSSRPGLTSSMNPPSLVRNTAKKQSKQLHQKSENISKIKKVEDQKFIQLVSKYSYLYDPKKHPHINMKQKQKSWTTIGKTFGMTGTSIADVCRSHWRSICMKNNKIHRSLNLGKPVSKEDREFINYMHFLPRSQRSTQKVTLTSREIRDSDDLLGDSVARLSRRLAPNQKNLFKSKIKLIFSEFSNAD